MKTVTVNIASSAKNEPHTADEYHCWFLRCLIRDSLLTPYGITQSANLLEGLFLSHELTRVAMVMRIS